jgi:hypothetical protein
MFNDSDKAVSGKPAAVPTGKTSGMAKAPRRASGNDEGGKFVSRDLKGVRGVNAQNQFAPTDAEPVRMRFKMGGGC